MDRFVAGIAWGEGEGVEGLFVAHIGIGGGGRGDGEEVGGEGAALFGELEGECFCKVFGEGIGARGVFGGVEGKSKGEIGRAHV